MKFNYKTESGVNGRVEADSEQLAVVMLSEQFGPEGATLIEATSQQAPTREPTAAAPATPADPHDWAAAFARASARGC